NDPVMTARMNEMNLWHLLGLAMHEVLEHRDKLLVMLIRNMLFDGIFNHISKLVLISAEPEGQESADIEPIAFPQADFRLARNSPRSSTKRWTNVLLSRSIVQQRETIAPD